MEDHIALFVTMYPASTAKGSKLLTHLRQGARDYYRSPSACCPTWSYLTPFSTKDPSNDTSLVIAGLEIYSNKSALQEQLNDTTFYQPFEEMVVEEELYSKKRKGSMAAWYLATGFVTRQSEREEGGKGVIVRVWKLTCGSGEKEAMVKALGEFADWSRGSDPGVLTFAVFTRKKAEREVLVYLRYRDKRSLRRIEDRPEYLNFW